MSSSKHMPVQEILLSPDPPWAVVPRTGDRTRSDVLETFGLDPARPVIVVGHQPVFWHAGILAKFIAADALAESTGAQLVHLVLDGHLGSYNEIHWPVHGEDGSLRRATWTFRDGDDGLPMAAQPACMPCPLPVEQPRGLDAIHRELEAAASSGDAAIQQSTALDRLMDPWVGQRTTITASALAASPIGMELAERMSSEPGRCRSTYNNALREHPGIDVAALGDGELPSWTMHEDGGIRTSLETDDRALRRFPKALFLTAMARLGLADVFIHGTGGARYDVCMEHWLDAWIDAQPCPIAVASATIVMDADTVLQYESLRQEMISSARRRKHDPSLRSGTGPSTGKTTLLAEMDSHPPKSPQRREAYRRMHETLGEMSGSSDGLLLPEERDRLQESMLIASDRTWAFPLHDPLVLDTMAAGIRGRMSEAIPS